MTWEKRWLQIALWAGVIALTGLIAYQLTLLWAMPRYHAALEQREQLQQENIRLQNQVESQAGRIAVLAQEVGVVRQANQTLMNAEEAQLSEMAELRNDLSFYQQLAGGRARPGLAIHRIEFRNTESTQVFSFSLTLTQNLDRATVIAGEAELQIEGVLDDRPTTLSWESLNAGSASSLKFEFKYFQQLEGLITLPEGFLASSVRAIINPASGQTVTEEYAWSRTFITAP